MFANMSERTDILPGLADFAKTMSSTLNQITDFFEEEIKIAGKYTTGIYYNPPIHGKAGSDGNLTLDKSAEHLNMEYLYTDLAPESPYLLLKTDFIQEGETITISTVETAESNPDTEVYSEIESENEIIVNDPDTLQQPEVENIPEIIVQTPIETAKQKKKRLAQEAKQLKESQSIQPQFQPEVQNPIDILKQKVITNPLYSNIFKPLDDSLEN